VGGGARCLYWQEMDRSRGFLGGRAGDEPFDHTGGSLLREKRQPGLAASPRPGTKPQATGRLFAGRTLEFHTLWAKDAISLVGRMTKRAYKASLDGMPVPEATRQQFAESLAATVGDMNVMEVIAWYRISRYDSTSGSRWRKYEPRDMCILKILREKFAELGKIFRRIDERALASVGADGQSYDCEKVRQKMELIRVDGDEAGYGPFNAHLFVCRIKKVRGSIRRAIRAADREISKGEQKIPTNADFILAYLDLANAGLQKLGRVANLLLNENALNPKSPLNYGD